MLFVCTVGAETVYPVMLNAAASGVLVVSRFALNVIVSALPSTVAELGAGAVRLVAVSGPKEAVRFGVESRKPPVAGCV